MNHYIFLNPDGTQELGLIIIVSAKTGITYAHQCGGFNNVIRELEGFAVPLGNYELVNKLSKFFYQQFHGYPPLDKSKYEPVWDNSTLVELQQIINQIPDWKTYRDGEGDDQRAFLEIDDQNIDKTTEGWIPVKTLYGTGVLLFKNSD